MGGVVIQFGGLSMSWSNTLLDFISIVTSQTYMKAILYVQIECQFCTLVQFQNIRFVFFYTLGYKFSLSMPQDFK